MIISLMSTNTLQQKYVCVCVYLEETVSAGRCTSRGVDWIHACELLSEIPHVQLITQLWLERACDLLRCQICPIQTLQQKNHVTATSCSPHCSIRLPFCTNPKSNLFFFK